MAKWRVVQYSPDRTVIAGAGGAAGGNTYHTCNPSFKNHTDKCITINITANFVACEGGFVTLYDDYPHQPTFVASQLSLFSITKIED